MMNNSDRLQTDKQANVYRMTSRRKNSGQVSNFSWDKRLASEKENNVWIEIQPTHVACREGAYKETNLFRKTDKNTYSMQTKTQEC